MARDKRPNRQPSGPGRTVRRPRPAAPAAKEGAPVSAPRSPVSPTRRRFRLRRPSGLAFTRRALIMFAVVALLGLSYAGSLRVLFAQTSDLATARQQIEERTSRKAELEQELERWEDPAYVEAQARTRLGWVMPGEIGYRVVGPDGQVVSGEQEIEGVGSAQPNELDARWWEHLAGSITAADEPQAVRR